MVARDPHGSVNALENATVERLIARLESRAKDQVLTRLFEKHVARRALPRPA